jgi:hypothetical protein
MIRKIFFIIAIITLVTLSALGKTPHRPETGFAAKTGEPAYPSVQNLPCGGRGDIKITKIHFTPPDNLGVTWVVERIPCHYDITGFEVYFDLLKGSNGVKELVLKIPSASARNIFFRGNLTDISQTQSFRVIVRGLLKPAIADFLSPREFQGKPDPSTPPASNLKLDITDIKINGSRSNPATMQVTWTVDKPTSDRIESYVLTLELSGNGVTGKVVQTPGSNFNSVPVGLLSIPADTRAKLFDPKSALTATVTLKATIFSGGQRKTVEHKETRIFDVISGSSGVR